MTAWLARQTLRLYALAYQRRYGDEMRALLEERPARAGTVLDLLRGALIAHLRSADAPASAVHPADRVRATTSGVLLCWLVFVATLFGFLETTQDHPYTGHAPPVVGIAQVAVQALALIASAAVVLGALPLTVAALAYARDHPGVRRTAALPFAAVMLFAALTGAVIAIARSDAPSSTLVASLGLAVVWGLTSVGCGATCVLACRPALFATPVARARLRIALAAGTLVTIAMIGFAAAVAIDGIALAANASQLAGDPKGPFGLLSASAWLIVEVSVMVAAAALATITTLRGWRGERELGAT
jgi:hypothetical protein